MLPGPRHNNPFVKDMFSKNTLELDYEVDYWRVDSGMRQSDRCGKTLEERIEGRKMYAAWVAYSLDVHRENILWSGMYRLFFFVFSNTISTITIVFMAFPLQFPRVPLPPPRAIPIDMN